MCTRDLERNNVKMMAIIVEILQFHTQKNEKFGKGQAVLKKIVTKDEEVEVYRNYR